MSTAATSSFTFKTCILKDPRLNYPKLRLELIELAATMCNEAVGNNDGLLPWLYSQAQRNTQNSVLGNFFLCDIRDIMLDIEKYEFSVLGIKYLILLGIISLIPKLFFLLLPGIYIQIGIDWNQFPAA